MNWHDFKRAQHVRNLYYFCAFLSLSFRPSFKNLDFRVRRQFPSFLDDYVLNRGVILFHSSVFSLARVIHAIDLSMWTMDFDSIIINRVQLLLLSLATVNVKSCIIDLLSAIRIIFNIVAFTIHSPLLWCFATALISEIFLIDFM